jgi:hypothetical protein
MKKTRRGKKKILFTGNVCAYLTCRLMGDTNTAKTPLIEPPTRFDYFAAKLKANSVGWTTQPPSGVNEIRNKH